MSGRRHQGAFAVAVPLDSRLDMVIDLCTLEQLVPLQ